MPITIDALEQDLYVLHWIGDLKLDEIRISHEETARMAAEAGTGKYAHILDLAEVKSFPFDPLASYRILTAHPQNFAVMVVGGPFLARSAIRILEKLLKSQIVKSFTNLDAAVQEARQLLAHKEHA